MSKLNSIKYFYVALMICFIIGGVILVIWPGIGVEVLLKVYGSFLILYGIAKVVSYYANDLFQLAFQFDFGLGIVAIIFGLVVILRTQFIVDFFAVCIGIFMLVDAALKIQTSLEAKRFGIRKWGLILGIAIVTGAIGAMLMFSPVKTVEIVIRIVGLSICVDGIMNLIVVCSTVKMLKNRRTEIIEGVN